MPKKVNMLDSKIMKAIQISPFMTFADFESIIGPEDNGKQNLGEPYSNKYQKHAACSFDYKLVCINGKFSQLFKPYLRWCSQFS